MGKFDKKVAVITGGARGLGKAIAEMLLSHGAKVAILDILDQEGKESVTEFTSKFGEGKAAYIHCDVSSSQSRSDAVLEVLTTFHNYHIFVNNAGINNEENMPLNIDVNLKAVVWFALHAEKYMNKLNGGQGGIIVNVASLAGIIGAPTLPVYSAAKHGVVGLTKSMAETLNLFQPGAGVKVVALCPAVIDTQLIADMYSNATNETFKEMMKTNMATNMLSASAVAEAVDRLMDDGTDNGSIMTVSKLEGEVYMHPPSMMK